MTEKTGESVGVRTGRRGQRLGPLLPISHSHWEQEDGADDAIENRKRMLPRERRQLLQHFVFSTHFPSYSLMKVRTFVIYIHELV